MGDVAVAYDSVPGPAMLAGGRELDRDRALQQARAPNEEQTAVIDRALAKLAEQI